jgi:phenylpyruvate tautomerase PptA (4-oxalocrotonate tautomerase family)
MTMPVITIEGAHLNKDQKRELVTALTKDVAGIMKVSEQSFIKEESIYVKKYTRFNR